MVVTMGSDVNRVLLHRMGRGAPRGTHDHGLSVAHVEHKTDTLTFLDDDCLLHVVWRGVDSKDAHQSFRRLTPYAMVGFLGDFYYPPTERMHRAFRGGESLT